MYVRIGTYRRSNVPRLAAFQIPFLHVVSLPNLTLASDPFRFEREAQTGRAPREHLAATCIKARLEATSHPPSPFCRVSAFRVSPHPHPLPVAVAKVPSRLLVPPWLPLPCFMYPRCLSVCSRPPFLRPRRPRRQFSLPSVNAKLTMYAPSQKV